MKRQTHGCKTKRLDLFTPGRHASNKQIRYSKSFFSLTHWIKPYSMLTTTRLTTLQSHTHTHRISSTYTQRNFWHVSWWKFLWHLRRQTLCNMLIVWLLQSQSQFVGWEIRMWYRSFDLWGIKTSKVSLGCIYKHPCELMSPDWLKN